MSINPLLILLRQFLFTGLLTPLFLSSSFICLEATEIQLPENKKVQCGGKVQKLAKKAKKFLEKIDAKAD